MLVVFWIPDLPKGSIVHFFDLVDLFTALIKCYEDSLFVLIWPKIRICLDECINGSFAIRSIVNNVVYGELIC